MATIKDNNYITIFGWMRTRLKLKNTTLLVYAAIYSFTQDGVNEYIANEQWLADFIGVSDRSIRTAMSELVKRGLIEKTNRNRTTGKTNAYTTIPLNIPEVEGAAATLPNNAAVPDTEGAEKISTPLGKNFHPGAEKISTLILNNINKIIKVRKKERKENKNACEGEVEGIFEEMTDDELIGFLLELTANVQGRQPTEAELEANATANAEIFSRTQSGSDIASRYEEQAKRAGLQPKKEPYDDIIYRHNFTGEVTAKMQEYIQFMFLNGYKPLNSQIEDICERLGTVTDSEEQVETIKRAMRKKYFDIRVPADDSLDYYRNHQRERNHNARLYP